MWVWRDSDNKVREFKMFGDDPKKCAICGQYFKKGEKGCAIVPPMEIRTRFPKLKQNLVVHYDEWIKFCDGITNDIELAEKFSRYRRPKKADFTEDEKRRIDAFRSASRSAGFWKETEKPYGLKCQKNGSSLYVEYNVYADSISIDFRGKRGLFDSFYERQITTNIYNKMHEILGDGQHDDYSASKTIEKIYTEARKNVDKMFG